jgi:hypothetical protein
MGKRGCKLQFHDLPKSYQDQAILQLYGDKYEEKNSNDASSKDANVEQSASDESLSKICAEEHDTRACKIHIHSVRNRLTDADGCCGKYAIDGIVAKKILPNDDPKCVKEVTFSQEKGKVEETRITLTWD